MEQFDTKTKAILNNIELVIFDVDGVLTDGKLYYIDGVECKAFNSRDGLGIALLLRAGIEVGIISGNKSTSVEARFKKFNLKYLYQGVINKDVAFQEILADMQITPEQVAYLGDDLIDLPIMQQVGFAGAVFDADEFVIEHADWVAECDGGFGAAREFCEVILAGKGLLEEIQAKFLTTEPH